MSMLNVHEVIVSDATAGAASADAAIPPVDGTVTLTFDQRRRSRLLAHLDDGRELGVLLPRGTVLHDGDRLRARDGSVTVVVRAAAESLSVGRTRHPHLLTRAAYHLGNRHVPVEIGPGWVAYAHDHVLDQLVRALGLEVESRVAPFEPEVGAFHTDRTGHGHSHSHGHGHGHSHSQPNPLDHAAAGTDHDHDGGSHHRH